MNGIEEQVLPLTKLPAGKRGVIRHHEQSDFQLTLMEMGCIPGEPVWIEMIAPMGDPLAIHIAGYHLSIRREDARKIMVAVVA